ncbi:hypothetical protein scyTo_0018917 [Scyliorhinus torazame]|uniref:DOCKER domain-containing protein n=1 Tax=Scyliorhinus torazame TaxID=75743 RepID=A0A401PP74_SCYTO|nr:hypothetical protein [Scyliorhinus torazame]
MVGPILEMTLVPEPELRRATIPIFFDMMQCEYSVNRSFHMFENELITKLDQEVEGGGGDEQYKVLLERTLLEHCRKHKYLAISGETFVLLVSSLLENLLDYRAIMHDGSKENKMSCTVNVLTFYKEKKREDIYIRYLYKLRDLHHQSCAAHLIHREDYQVLTNRELKEKLYQEIIHYCDKGKNRMFIHRGKEYERYEDFRLKLATHFPNAEKMTSTAPPSDELKTSPKQYAQCFTVKPVLNLPLHYKDKPVPEQILNFYRANEVQQFQYSRPFRKGKKDPDNEFATMWIERVTYTTAYNFPGILQWFEVKATMSEEISPLENAIETMERTNEKISNMVQQYAWDRTLPAHPLSMLLSGIVDASVMGGLANYEKAFFNSRYLQDHPEDQEKIETLKQLIALQIPLLTEGIRIHGEKSTEELKPLHARIASCFKELKEKVEKLYGVITLAPSLTDRKRSRSGSMVLPYIMSSTLWRLSTISVASSAASSSSTSSDSASSRPASNGSILDPLLERRPLPPARPDDTPDKDEFDGKASKSKRRERNLSKSQVIFERGQKNNLSTEKIYFSKIIAPQRPQRPKSLQFGDSRHSPLQTCSSQLTYLSLPSAAPSATRTLSYPTLQSSPEVTPDSVDLPPPTPPKNKPYEIGSQRDVSEVAPRLPDKISPRPPTPPPKVRRSQSIISAGYSFGAE